MKRGILLIAIGNESYIRMAAVMAASIRCNDAGLSIAVVTDIPLEERYKQLFDHTILLPQKDYIINDKKEYVRSKLLVYQLSPFDETIFLDVDQVLLPGKKISQLFEELKEVELTFANTGPAAVSVWVDLHEIKEKYGDKPFWNFHSELFYFKKGKIAKKYFAAALKVYDNAQLKTAFPFAGGKMADELAFQIASIQTGIYPHKDNWTPNFWYVRHPKLSNKYPYQLSDFITYSIGGASLPPHIKVNYNNLAAYYFSKLKLQNPYKVKDKRAYLPERAKL